MKIKDLPFANELHARRTSCLNGISILNKDVRSVVIRIPGPSAINLVDVRISNVYAIRAIEFELSSIENRMLEIGLEFEADDAA